MFDEFILNETLVDHQMDMLSEYQCECGEYLQKDWDGDLFCKCGATYTVQTTIYTRREVN